MKQDLLELLRCPVCGGTLTTTHDWTADPELTEGTLRCSTCVKEYPVTNAIPRFVPAANYAANFGFQWNRFRATQLDSHTGLKVSRDRFLHSTGIAESSLAGKVVLDVGCGAGRFSEVALSLGARVVALDYSTAVDACRANLGADPALSLTQGDIYHLPFAPEAFDLVYCLGVLQHTPDVEGAFAALPRFVKPAGRLAVDVYPWLITNLFWSKYWLRPITRRLPQQLLFKWVQALAPRLLPLSNWLGRIPGLRGRLRYLVPVVNYRGVFPLTDRQIEEWAVLDTFDMLAPAHDHPQTAKTLRDWFNRAGLEDVYIGRPGHLVGYGRKPAIR